MINEPNFWPISPISFLRYPPHRTIEMIDLQIELGGELLKFTIENQCQLDEQKKKYQDWNEHNKKILREICTSTELINRYTSKNIQPKLRPRLLSPEFSAAVTSMNFFTGQIIVHVEANAEKQFFDREIYYRKSISIDLEKLESIKKWISSINFGKNINRQENIEMEKIDSRKVFIVHGHDNGAKDYLARVLTELDFYPIILHEQANGGKTVIEKFEKYAGQVIFAVVLFTPDDEGKAKNDEDLKARARQNVIFELGYFVGILGRGKVVLLYKGGDIPSDLSGVIYQSMLDSQWKIDLVKELKEAGIEVDANKLI